MNLTELFLKCVNMSISACWIVLVLLIVRLLLKKMPKWLNPILWGFVGLRLVIPFAPKSLFSLIPSAETISPDIVYSANPQIYTGIPFVNSTVNPVISETFAPAVGDSANPLQIILGISGVLWVAGCAAMLLYALISYTGIRKKVKTAVLLRDNIYQSENVPSAFVLGIFRPRIYLPFGVSENEREYVIAHENTHIKRRDYLIKPIGFLILSVYWFNPLLWIAYVLLCRDIELACDERTIKNFDRLKRAEYSSALLSLGVTRKSIAACPVAFGEVDIKKRVKNVLNYKKPAFWIIAAAIAFCVIFALCFLTNPVRDSDKEYDNDSYEIINPDNGIIPDGTVSVKEDDTGSLQAGESLTLDDVITLSKKGDNLNWQDFEKYPYTETGSGLMIRIYDIDDMFSLAIGGSPEQKPLYINLQASTFGYNSIDIRVQSPEDFINEFKDKPVAIPCTSYSSYCDLGTSEDGYDKAVEIMGTPAQSLIDGGLPLPMCTVKSREELTRLYEKMAESFDTNIVSQDNKSFSQTVKEYDDAFFKGNTLFVIFVPSVTDSAQCSADVSLSGNTAFFGVSIYDEGSFAGLGRDYAVFVEVPSDRLTDVTELSAAVASHTYDNGEKVGFYVFNGSKDTVKPTLTLYDNDTFEFIFSALSSYIGTGTYSTDGGKLTLNTFDFDQTYVFDITENGLKFDADASSENLWFSDITDGAFFAEHKTAE